MDSRDKKILHLQFGLTVLNILKDAKTRALENKKHGTKDHKLVSSLRKLAAASGIDYGTVQKISKGDQGFEFFTFMDLLEALGIDIIEFGQHFQKITLEQVKEYQVFIQRSRKEKKKKRK